MTLLQVRQFNARFLKIAWCSEAYDPLTMEGILMMGRGPVHLLNSSARIDWEGNLEIWPRLGGMARPETEASATVVRYFSV